MLLSVHVTSVLFVVLVGNSALTMGYGLVLRLHTLTLVTRSYALLFEYRLSPIDTMIELDFHGIVGNVLIIFNVSITLL